MSEKLRRFLDVFADFGESFLRKSGRGILDGVYSASRLLTDAAVTVFAVYFAFQIIEVEKNCKSNNRSAHISKFKAPQIQPVPQKITLDSEGRR